MFNSFAVLILERLHGRKLPVLLADITGTTERTWRSRLGKEVLLADDEVKRLRGKSAAYVVSKMQTVDGLSADEAGAVVAGAPSLRSAVPLPTADLIYWFSPAYGTDYVESNALAVRFDQYCDALLAAARLDDIEETRRVVLDTLDWLRGFCNDAPDQEADDAMAQRLRDAHDIGSLHKEARQLAYHMLMHVLSCWDVEFNALYFQGVHQPYPLFTLVMPRLAPDIEIDKATGQLLRRGRKPRHKVYEKSIFRFFNFLAVMFYWSKYRRFPDRLPRVSEMVAWCDERESEIVSWRDETTRFSARNLFKLWRTVIKPDRNGLRAGTPLPMLVAALLWSPLLKLNKGRPNSLTVCSPDYLAWWRRNLQRLTAKGFQFGDAPWPACLVGNGALQSLDRRHHLPTDFP